MSDILNLPTMTFVMDKHWFFIWSGSSDYSIWLNPAGRKRFATCLHNIITQPPNQTSCHIVHRFKRNGQQRVIEFLTDKIDKDTSQVFIDNDSTRMCFTLPNKQLKRVVEFLRSAS